MTAQDIYTGWEPLIRIIVTAAAVYFLCIFFVRLHGKRTTAGMNNFDWIVTVAMGSMVASTVLTTTVPLINGLAGILTLMFLQFLVTASSYRWQWAKNTFLAKPQLLFYRGQYLRDAMRHERVSESEIQAAIRQKSNCPVDHIFAVVLEQDAVLSVITDECDIASRALEEVRGYERATRDA